MSGSSAIAEKPLHELLSRSMVDIYVGPENTHWVLHEKLLCYHSPFFRSIFIPSKSKSSPSGKSTPPSSSSKSFGLPEEEDVTFKTFVGWLYSSSLPVPREEADLGLHFDLYLMAEKFQIPGLVSDVLQVVREWYKYSDTYPGLRRVQYIYANTEEGSPMRHMLVHSVARLFAISKDLPQHWDKALRKNGQLAVDIIRAIQEWRLEEDVVPDARDDPAEAEELIGEEEIQDAMEDNVDVEDDGEGVTGDESEETVVESPVEAKQVKQESKEDVKKKGNDIASGISKIAGKELPNGVATGDYGTLRAAH